MAGSNQGCVSRRDFLRLLLVAGGGIFTSCIGRVSSTTPGTINSTLISPTQNISSSSASDKIKHIIVILQENHSFDSLFASFPGADGIPASNQCPENIVHSMPGTEKYKVAYYCSYSEELIPNYWRLARNFTLCDRYFSEVQGPSFPNYLMLTSAQSPTVVDPRQSWTCPNVCEDFAAIPNRLDESGLSWRDYGGLFASFKSLSSRKEISLHSMDNFYQDAANGALQNVIYIGSFLLGGKKESGHPPSNICDAENFAVNIVNAVMASPQWPSTLLFLIWDEWGGFYDHVVPPVVERQKNGDPFRYGFRVPCIVISPYAQKGKVSHTEYSHVSILKTIESIFNLTSLTERDADAHSLLDCLDFSQVPLKPFNISLRTCTS